MSVCVCDVLVFIVTMCFCLSLSVKTLRLRCTVSAQKIKGERCTQIKVAFNFKIN